MLNQIQEVDLVPPMQIVVYDGNVQEKRDVAISIQSSDDLIPFKESKEATDWEIHAAEREIEKVCQSNLELALEYNEHMDRIKTANFDYRDAEKKFAKSLIEFHFRMGEHLYSLRHWFSTHCRINNWAKYVLSTSDYPFSFRTAQRDIRLWEKFKDVVIENWDIVGERTTLQAMYAMSAPTTSDTGFDMALTLLQAKVNDENFVRLTDKEAKKVIAIGQVIDEMPDEKQKPVRNIAEKWGVSGPETVKDLGDLGDEQLEEIYLTGQLVTRDDDDNFVHKVLVSEASSTDVEMYKGDQTAIKRFRQLEAIANGASERDAKEGVRSVKMGTVTCGYDEAVKLFIDMLENNDFKGDEITFAVWDRQTV